MPPGFEKIETHAMRLYPVCNVPGERLFPLKLNKHADVPSVRRDALHAQVEGTLVLAIATVLRRMQCVSTGLKGLWLICRYPFNPSNLCADFALCFQRQILESPQSMLSE